MSTPYRTLFTGTLVQESALSVGGSEAIASLVDSPLCRDAMGRFVLRGHSLAGALVATARKLVMNLPDDISGTLEQSRWQVFTSHPDGAPQSEFRQHVGIRQDTGATSEGVLFDVEVLSRGTRWPFLLEVDTGAGSGGRDASHGDAGAAAERIAAAALLEWGRGRAWIGREVARGLGWLRLENLVALRLDVETHVDLWPDSRRAPDDAIRKLSGVPLIPAARFATVFDPLPAQTDWRYCELDGTIEVGDSANGYGVDALSIGGHATVTESAAWTNRYLAARDRDLAQLTTAFAPDHTFVATRRNDGSLEPFLPGSSLRGPLRHALSRRLRARGDRIIDPNDGARSDEERPLPLFGTMNGSAALLVRDAYLSDPERWGAAWLQHHAEDEFAGGVFGSGKFDRTMLVEGSFAWRMVIETKGDDGFVVDELIPTLRQLAASGHLPIGGAKWRSAGWPAWKLNEPRFGKAGEEAR